MGKGQEREKGWTWGGIFWREGGGTFREGRGVWKSQTEGRR
jgi:hypothetical protein